MSFSSQIYGDFQVIYLLLIFNLISFLPDCDLNYFKYQNESAMFDRKQQNSVKWLSFN